MRKPGAEVEVTGALVEELVAAQHPDLLDDLELLADGWDNVVFRLGRRLTVRLPRRAAAVPLVRNEQRWLPVLAPHLDLPVPVPVRVGSPTDAYPWPWSISPWFEGRPLIHEPVPDRGRYAPTLGRFLAGLHRVAPADAPANPFQGVPLAHRSALFTQHLALVTVAEAERLRTLWERSLATPAWLRDPVWLHGDPHPGNVLVDGDRISAVIDFGDLTAGDPATDLASAWLTFDAVGRRRLADEYARWAALDADTWARARGWALAIGLALLAGSDDEPALAAVGRHALDQVVSD